ncbi:hypothetical protein [Streptomyces sp. S.PNR 29]|uniref:hypothetical protein n=1 Tax=Streptomyces sp. S.PNR 29 TaxID=2973805 RepID=UPI0025B266EA|nr:hypothetical protein [Streptomyces sp. S.PNR 29]MDN0198098.1 hypothetical protein [Streptomyces sp. S.PNR 29]
MKSNAVRARRGAKSLAFSVTVRTYHEEGVSLDRAGQEAIFASVCANYRPPAYAVLTDELWERIQDAIWEGIQDAATAISKKETNK